MTQSLSWITWAGGERPVFGGDNVDVMYPNGLVVENVASWKVDWTNNAISRKDHIIAYRPHSTTTKGEANKPPKTAAEFLTSAKQIMDQRGKQYDQPQGERSMERAVCAFNCITGNKLTASDGWLFMQVLKDVRQWQNPDKYHEDSALDGVAYAALKAESLAEGNK